MSLKVAEAEVEVEGAPLCIAPRPGTRMIWGTNNTLGGGSISGPEYAEARPLRSDCQGTPKTWSLFFLILCTCSFLSFLYCY